MFIKFKTIIYMILLIKNINYYNFFRSNNSISIKFRIIIYHLSSKRYIKQYILKVYRVIHYKIENITFIFFTLKIETRCNFEKEMIKVFN